MASVLGKTSVIIGLDALDWEVYEKLRSQGYLGSLERLISKGATKGSIRCIPPFTPPIWTSIASGVNPGKHGIMGFFEVDEYGRPLRISTSLDVQAPRLHDIVSYEGGRSLVAGLPLVVKPYIPFKGVALPDRFMYEVRAKPEWVDRIYRTNLREAEISLGGEDKICRLAAFEVALAESVRDILERDNDYNLVFTLFSLVDVFMHNKPDILENVRRSKCVSRALEEIDKTINLIIDHYKEDDLIIVVSDHGIAPVRHAISVNKILYDRGLLRVEWRKYEGKPPAADFDGDSILGRLLGLAPRVYNALIRIPFIRRPVYKLGRFIVRKFRVLESVSTEALRPRPDPVRSLAYFIASGYGSIYVNERLVNDVDKVIVEVVNALRSAEERLDMHLFDYIGKGRGKAMWGPYAKKAPHVIVVPAKGFTIAGSITDNYIVSPILRGEHTMNNMHIISVPSGAGDEVTVASELVAEPWDYANLALGFLGLPMPSYADGRVAKYLRAKVGSKDYRGRFKLAKRLAGRVLRGAVGAG